ncbi:hypothetical protein PV433_20550 [Paenibacillus sp. GYB004]|uniref:hypothetical protein n=1 Tax=Paenibacillus sp. GYB004 TaxID=2994393 RepID=UPI002F964D8B
MKNKAKFVTIHKNMLGWYNELEDELDVQAANFPPAVLSLIRQLGDYEIDYIDNKKMTLVSKPKMVPKPGKPKK